MKSDVLEKTSRYLQAEVSWKLYSASVRFTHANLEEKQSIEVCLGPSRSVRIGFLQVPGIGGFAAKFKYDLNATETVPETWKVTPKISNDVFIGLGPIAGNLNYNPFPATANFDFGLSATRGTFGYGVDIGTSSQFCVEANPKGLIDALHGWYESAGKEKRDESITDRVFELTFDRPTREFHLLDKEHRSLESFRESIREMKDSFREAKESLRGDRDVGMGDLRERQIGGRERF